MTKENANNDLEAFLRPEEPTVNEDKKETAHGNKTFQALKVNRESASKEKKEEVSKEADIKKEDQAKREESNNKNSTPAERKEEKQEKPVSEKKEAKETEQKENSSGSNLGQEISKEEAIKEIENGSRKVTLIIKQEGEGGKNKVKEALQKRREEKEEKKEVAKKVPVKEEAKTPTEEDFQALDEEDEEEKTQILSAPEPIENPTITDEESGEIIRISSPVFRIGKSKVDNDYRIDGNKAISRHHLIIISKNRKYYVQDNNSTNGTFINGYRIPPETEVELKDEQKLKIADKTYIFKV